MNHSQTQENKISIYVDGSYDPQTNRYSYGLVIPNKLENYIPKDSSLPRKSYVTRTEYSADNPYMTGDKFGDRNTPNMNNVAGEIEGAKAAIRYAINHHFDEVIIYHDLEGTAYFCNGEWTPTKPETIAYKAYYKESLKKIKITFIYVKAHVKKGGTVHNKLNNCADQISRQMLGLSLDHGRYPLQDPPK